MSMYKIAVVGEEEAVLGFRSLGADIFALGGPEQGEKILAALKRGKYGVVFLTEQAAEALPELVKAFEDQPLPAVAIIPRIEGSLGLARCIRKIVERAVIAEILFQEEGRS